MEVQCVVCGRSVDTKKEEVTVTTGWVLDEAAKINEVKHEGSFPRVSMICAKCWRGVIKEKPEEKNCFWTYNKEI